MRRTWHKAAIGAGLLALLLGAVAATGHTTSNGLVPRADTSHEFPWQGEFLWPAAGVASEWPWQVSGGLGEFPWQGSPMAGEFPWQGSLAPGAPNSARLLAADPAPKGEWPWQL